MDCMKIPHSFLSRALSTTLLVAVCAIAFPQTSSARDYGRRPWFGPHRPAPHEDHRDDHRVRRSTGADVQRALARRGYYHGPVDGDIGPGTRRAIARYQSANGLRPTGEINSSLLRSLHID